MDTTPPSFPTSGSTVDASPPEWRRKLRYHHGDLRESALRRGREIVALHGPTGLTLRGLARDLGVTAPALVYYFGSLAGLRAAVAESVLEQLEAACCEVPQVLRRTADDVARAWIAFAASNAHLYRLAAGEGWSRHSGRSNGYNHPLCVPSPRRLLETLFFRRARGRGKPDPERARYLAFSVHGLALAGMDGVPEAEVGRGLERLLAAPA